MFFDKPVSKHQQLIESDLQHVLMLLPKFQPDSEEYAKVLTSAERLNKMLDNYKPATVSRDTLATIGANLFGILLIIRHEDMNVITSKALGFVMRIK